MTISAKNVLTLLLISTTNAAAFVVESPSQRLSTKLNNDYGGPGSSKGSVGSIETIEFKIYPDGRVEETVRGVKGGNCHKVTEKINEQLGMVVNSAPTEEMYEQDLTVDQTLIQTEGASWDGSTPSSW
jgi:Protein of unknown function (DUF2997)